MSYLLVPLQVSSTTASVWLGATGEPERELVLPNVGVVRFATQTGPILEMVDKVRNQRSVIDLFYAQTADVGGGAHGLTTVPSGAYAVRQPAAAVLE